MQCFVVRALSMAIPAVGLHSQLHRAQALQANQANQKDIKSQLQDPIPSNLEVRHVESTTSIKRMNGIVGKRSVQVYQLHQQFPKNQDQNQSTIGQKLSLLSTRLLNGIKSSKNIIPVAKAKENEPWVMISGHGEDREKKDLGYLKTINYKLAVFIDSSGEEHVIHINSPNCFVDYEKNIIEFE